jgi:hypothetical protein
MSISWKYVSEVELLDYCVYTFPILLAAENGSQNGSPLTSTESKYYFSTPPHQKFNIFGQRLF